MRPRIRELTEQLETAGFSVRHGAKSNRLNYRHPAGANITIPGEPGDIAKYYLINDVMNAIYLIDNERN
jgi:predicted RNA binding protein YcfA (HicA-like mRNA interferase family)